MAPTGDHTAKEVSALLRDACSLLRRVAKLFAPPPRWRIEPPRDWRRRCERPPSKEGQWMRDVIETKRLLLRRWQGRDEEELVRLFGDPAVQSGRVLPANRVRAIHVSGLRQW